MGRVVPSGTPFMATHMPHLQPFLVEQILLRYSLVEECLVVGTRKTWKWMEIHLVPLVLSA